MRLSYQKGIKMKVVDVIQKMLHYFMVKIEKPSVRRLFPNAYRFL